MCACLFLQKWSKGKQKEKVNNAVLFDQATYDKLLTEAPKFKQITPSILSERLRVNSSFQIYAASVQTCCLTVVMAKLLFVLIILNAANLLLYLPSTKW
jgi:hypothetical protein